MIELTEAESRRIHHYSSRKDVALELIRSAIIDGRLEAGVRLDQNEIASSLGVSRMPVREALKQLEIEGLVVVYPYRGVEVARLDTKDIEEMFAMRGALERLAAERGLSRLTPVMLASMRAQVEAMDRITAGTEPDANWASHNHQFHTILNDACGWPRLVAQIERLRANVDRYVRLYVSVRGRSQSQREHHAILAACEAGDVAALCQAVEDHSRNTSAFLIESIKTSQNTDIDADSDIAPVAAHSRA